MSISKRRRRARNRRIKKWRKRARKIQARYNRELQYSELFDQFHTYLNEEYQRGCITLYRWVHDPFTADVFKPQIFQSFSDRDISDVYIPTPIENVKRIKKYVDLKENIENHLSDSLRKALKGNKYIKLK